MLFSKFWGLSNGRTHGLVLLASPSAARGAANRCGRSHGFGSNLWARMSGVDPCFAA